MFYSLLFVEIKMMSFRGLFCVFCEFQVWQMYNTQSILALQSFLNGKYGVLGLLGVAMCRTNMQIPTGSVWATHNIPLHLPNKMLPSHRPSFS
uniref:Uncharacterized protein n=1 Tax=Anguilla anguilla TaxID=7936 RepID=A0A0E9RM06_ANGAN